jgi:hypothetical protein
MSVVSIHGRDVEVQARASLPPEMGEAGWLLQSLLEGGDLVGRDDAGRMVVVLAIEPRDFDRLMAFGANAVESEDGGDDEPYEVTPMSPCWAWEADRVFTGIPLQ